MPERPVVVHIIYRLDIGGLETVLTEFINNCPEEKYHHEIIALTHATAFKNRITNKNVSIRALNKKSGKDMGIFFKILAILKALKPKVVHTYNIACLEYQLAAFITRVPLRIHAEHGRDNSDIYGENPRYNILRKVMDKAVHFWVPVSKDLETWLIQKIGIPPKKVRLIYNGVDTERFRPGQKGQTDKKTYTIGSVGRLDPVKNHLLLIRAFSDLLKKPECRGKKIELNIIGEGPEREVLENEIRDLNLQDHVALPGSRDAIREILKGFDLFVLSSKAEGIPMTILEAAACGLAVVSTRVGGIPEIFKGKEQMGTLVPSENAGALASAIQAYMDDPRLSLIHGAAARKQVLERFSLKTMVRGYLELYNAH